MSEPCGEQDNAALTSRRHQELPDGGGIELSLVEPPLPQNGGDSVALDEFEVGTCGEDPVRQISSRLSTAEQRDCRAGELQCDGQNE